MLRRGNAKLGIARSLKQKNQIEEAIIIAEQALEIANEFDVKDLSKDANKLLSVIYAKAGRYNEAYQFSKILLDVKPDNELVKSTEKLYQSTIELLRLNQKAEQMNIERKVYIILIIVGIVFTIFLVVYSIYTLRLFRSRNTVLKALVKKNLQQLDDERKLKEALNQQLSSKKLTRKSTDEEKDSLLFKEFTKWLTEGKHYLRKDLTVEMVAKELNTNREYLSRAVSSQQIHFNELINKYRVEEVIKIFSDKTDRRNKYNMNIIASDSGFKSMSVFIEAFRKQTGMNPALFRDTVKVNDLLKNNYLIDNI
jgi:AraC-like DNA-binding protein